MKNLKHYHTIKVRFLGATNYRPARMVIETDRFKQRKYISFEEVLPGSDNTRDKAHYLLKLNGYDIAGYSSESDHYLFFTPTFKALENIEYVLYWNGEEVDRTDTKAEADYLKKEYEMAYKGAVKIKKETSKFLRK